MFRFYFYGSYIYAFTEVCYRVTHEPKMFHSTTIPSSIFTLSYLLLPPLVLPIHLINQGISVVLNKN